MIDLTVVIVDQPAVRPRKVLNDVMGSLEGALKQTKDLFGRLPPRVTVTQDLDALELRSGSEENSPSRMSDAVLLLIDSDSSG